MKNTTSEKLIAEGDFLAFTLSNIGKVFEPFSFDVDGVATNELFTGKIKVEVLEEGIILLSPEVTRESDRLVSTSNAKYVLPKILLSCGIHGNETAPIEICQQLIQKIIHGKFELQVNVLFIFGNLDAIKAQKRFISQNLNTLFSGQHSLADTSSPDYLNNDNIEKKRACVIEHWVDWFFNGFDIPSNITNKHHQTHKEQQYIHLDLHTAIRESKYEKFAISPYLQGRLPSIVERAFLTKCGLECLLIAHTPTKAFTYFTSSQYQAVSYTLELGQVRPWGENNLEACADFTKGLNELLSGKSELLQSERYSKNADVHLLSQPINHLKFHQKLLPLFSMHREILRTSERFCFNFSDDVANFSGFPIGYALAQNGDEIICVEKSDEAILFPNADVAVGQRALLTVIPIDD